LVRKLILNHKWNREHQHLFLIAEHSVTGLQRTTRQFLTY